MKINNTASRQKVISQIELLVHAEHTLVKCESENGQVFDPLQQKWKGDFEVMKTMKQFSHEHPYTSPILQKKGHPGELLHVWGYTLSFFHDIIAALLRLHIELRTIQSKMRKILIVILYCSFRCLQGAVKTRRHRLCYPATGNCSVCQIMSLPSICSLLNTTFLTTPIYQVLHKWFLFCLYFTYIWAKWYLYSR